MCGTSIDYYNNDDYKLIKIFATYVKDGSKLEDYQRSIDMEEYPEYKFYDLCTGVYDFGRNAPNITVEAFVNNAETVEDDDKKETENISPGIEGGTDKVIDFNADIKQNNGKEVEVSVKTTTPANSLTYRVAFAESRRYRGFFRRNDYSTNVVVYAVLKRTQPEASSKPLTEGTDE